MPKTTISQDSEILLMVSPVALARRVHKSFRALSHINMHNISLYVLVSFLFIHFNPVCDSWRGTRLRVCQVEQLISRETSFRGSREIVGFVIIIFQIVSAAVAKISQ